MYGMIYEHLIISILIVVKTCVDLYLLSPVTNICSSDVSDERRLFDRSDILANDLKPINTSKTFCLGSRSKARGQRLNLSKEVDFEEEADHCLARQREECNVIFLQVNLLIL
jgi:hypothetical protein